MIMPEKPDIRVLALDTSSRRGSVALLQGREVAAELRLDSLETHSARLLRSVEFLLDSTGWSLQDLGLVAAGSGPGSFTGIRIGVATALGLAQALSVPFAGISGLDAAASQTFIPDGRLGVVLDAGRSQLYYAEYVCARGRAARDGNPGLWFPSDLIGRVRSRRLYLVGDGTARLMEEMRSPKPDWPRPIAADLFLASSIGRLALSRRRWWKSGEFLSAEPLYIRPPDAMRSKGGR